MNSTNLATWECSSRQRSINDVVLNETSDTTYNVTNFINLKLKKKILNNDPLDVRILFNSKPVFETSREH